jgi:hypothetical protein
VTLNGDHDDEFLSTACRAMRSGSGADALDALGWWELVEQLDDPDARAAVFAVFRAQGRELADSPALGGLVAQPFVAGSSLAPDTVVAGVRRRSRGRGSVWVTVGPVGARHILFDDPDQGVRVVPADAVELRPVDVPGRVTLHEVSVDLDEHAMWAGPVDVDVARTRSRYLGRVAAAAEILGAAEGAVDLAVQYAGDRVQFGRPIGSFQAVRHLLAWAQTDCVAVAAVLREALDLLADPPPQFGAVTKALAGRNGRRACQRSLQVLGGIGFTAEHPHHHHYSRVLALDALLGTSAELTTELGTWLRTERTDPRYPATVLHARR